MSEGRWEEQGSCAHRVRAEMLEPASTLWLSAFLKRSHYVLFEKQTIENAGQVGLTQTAFRPAWGSAPAGEVGVWKRGWWNRGDIGALDRVVRKGPLKR